ncbi:MAG: RluA family pseudouridine synthase [Deltaproteobacteria bacterium]|nr:RluA family pseudouridine synthase [Deltaproteobacteria bacterium]
MTGLAWSRAEALVTTRRVAVTGTHVTEPGRRVAAGEVVTVTPDAPRITRGMLEPERVVYVDPDVIVVDKPAGVMTVPFEHERDTLLDRARVWVKRHGGPGSDELGIVHRLDKDTSGLVVFARGLAAKKALARQFEAHTIERRYEAIVHGRAATRTWDTWLVKNRGDGIRGSWRPLRPDSQPPRDAQRAVTHVEAIEVMALATLVGCRLETGRTHQIRIHLAEAGTPIVGEQVYIRDLRAARGKEIEAPRQMLHARVIAFVHPRDGRTVRLEVQPPEDFTMTLARLRAGQAT